MTTAKQKQEEELEDARAAATDSEDDESAVCGVADSSADDGSARDRTPASEERFNELLARAAALSGAADGATACAKTPGAPPDDRVAPLPAPRTHLRRRTSSGLAAAETPELLERECAAAAEEAPLVTRHYESSPPFLAGGTLKGYQVAALNWLIRRHDAGLSAILADEMGLGKTVESIALLGYLSAVRGERGPYLVLAPKSTLANWAREFARWVPFLGVVRFDGDRAARAQQRAAVVAPGRFDVLLTSFEVAIIEKAALHRHAWRYIVIDEAHRIKNERSVLSQVVRWLHSDRRLLLTGTPLQNNLHELWALLNFLVPSVFSSADDFDAWFRLAEAGDAAHQRETVARLHRVLQPFMLRRLKADAARSLPPKHEVKLFVGMTPLQTEWYRRVLTKDFATISALERSNKNSSSNSSNNTYGNGSNSSNGSGSGINSQTSKMQLLNIIMQLRKVCNHPYLFDGAEVGHEDGSTGEDLVTSAGKMVVLDKLLRYLRGRGSRVLIFSQMTRMLDILEDYLVLRDYAYCRIDGQTDAAARDAQIDAFNAPDSPVFAFLLSTRAGGLGLNLATADTVVLYDSDWNPQVDLQAEDRVHRIGQQRPVTVYRFVTEHSVEMKILQRAERKLQLDALVVQHGRLPDRARGAAGGASGAELLAMVRFGADDLARAAAGTLPHDEDIEAILARGAQQTTALDASLRTQAAALLRLDGTADADEPDYLTWDGVNWREARRTGATSGEQQSQQDQQQQHHHTFTLRDLVMSMPKRERPQTLSEDTLWRLKNHLPERAAERAAVPTEPVVLAVPKCPRPPRQPVLHDFQFYAPRLAVLLAKERAAYEARRRAYETRAPEAPAGGFGDLSAAEAAERDALVAAGFGAWSWRDYLAFVRGAERYGRADYAHIAEEVGTKSAAEVRAYAAVFWARCGELREGARAVRAIERGEARLRKSRRLLAALDALVARYADPWTQLTAVPFRRGRTADVAYTDAEDCFLLCAIHEYGLGNWDAVRRRVLQCPRFEMDWFMRSRTEADLARRGDILLRLIERNPAAAEDDTPASVSSKTSTKKKQMAAAASSKAPERKGCTRPPPPAAATAASEEHGEPDAKKARHTPSKQTTIDSLFPEKADDVIT